MTAQSKIRPFNAMAAYEAEREENRRLYSVVYKALHFADSMADKLERAGVDASVYRGYIAELRRDSLADIAA